MKSKKEKRDTLDGVLDKIWLMLEQGAAHSDDPFHWPVLGTKAKEGCSMRTVILRQVNVPGSSGMETDCTPHGWFHSYPV